MSDRHEFNKSLSRYISQRKRWRPHYSSLFRFDLQTPTFLQKKQPEEDSVDLSQMSAPLPLEETSTNAPPEPIFEDDRAQSSPVVLEQLPSSYPESLWQRLTGLFAKPPSLAFEPQPPLEHSSELKSDVKLLATHFVSLLEQMSHREREKLKQTEHFSAIKEIFRKHHIIK